MANRLLLLVLMAGCCDAGDSTPGTDTGDPEDTHIAPDGDTAEPEPERVYPDPLPETIGGDRPAAYVLPEDYDTKRDWPLVLLLHGYGANVGARGINGGLLQDTYLQLSNRGTEYGFVTLIPHGTEDPENLQFWNATDYCCDFHGSGIDDVTYLIGLLDEAFATFRLDPSRVYLVGHSNGAFMSYRLACEIPERITAIVGLAGTGTECENTEPVSVLHVHGTADDTILYDGDEGEYIGAVATADYWASRNGCDAVPTDAGRLDLITNLDGEETRRDRYPACDEGVAVELWTMEEGVHIPAFGADFSARILDWAFDYAK